MSVRTQVILSVLIILVAAALMIVFLPKDEKPAPPEHTEQPMASAPAEQTSAKFIVTPAPVNAMPETTPEISAEPEVMGDPEIDDTQSALDILLERAGYSSDALPGSQLLVADAYGQQADLYRFELVDGKWVEAGDVVTAWIGENGVSWEKQEGDGTTPGGLYLLGYGFGIEYPDEVHIDYRMVTDESYWVDDPDSVFYNTWVEGTEEQDWDSAEYLAAYPAEYAFAVVIEYNTGEPVYGAGSAIFLHCGAYPTAGCIAVEREDMLSIFSWLQPDSNASILIF